MAAPAQLPSNALFGLLVGAGVLSWLRARRDLDDRRAREPERRAREPEVTTADVRADARASRGDAVALGSKSAGVADAPVDGAGRWRVIKCPEDYRPQTPWWATDAASWVETGLPAGIVPLRCPHVEAVAAADWLPEPPLGAACKRKLFLLEKDAIYLNHGSYGAALRPAAKAQAWWRDRMESQPVRFMETELLPALHYALEDLAWFVGAEPRDVAPLTNATSGINAMVRSIKLRPGDLLMCTSLTYPAVKSALAHAAGAAGARLLEVVLDVATLSSDARITDAVTEALAAHPGRVRFALLDHVISFPPVIMPLESLAAACVRSGVVMAVDGAHALGSLPLNLTALSKAGVSFYTGNAHKWLCAPKGVAFLWARRDAQPGLHASVISHGYCAGMRAEFVWEGTRDLTAWLALPAALAVFRAVGAAKIRELNNVLAAEAAATLAKNWGAPRTLPAAGAPLAAMVAIELPAGLIGGLTAPGGDATPGGGGARAVGLRTALPPPAGGRVATRHGMCMVACGTSSASRHVIPVPVFSFEGRLWARISAQLYNEWADYEALSSAILQIWSGAV